MLYEVSKKKLIFPEPVTASVSLLSLSAGPSDSDESSFSSVVLSASVSLAASDPLSELSVSSGASTVHPSGYGRSPGLPPAPHPERVARSSAAVNKTMVIFCFIGSPFLQIYPALI